MVLSAGYTPLLDVPRNSIVTPVPVIALSALKATTVPMEKLRLRVERLPTRGPDKISVFPASLTITAKLLFPKDALLGSILKIMVLARYYLKASI